ncbi:SDR family NAD(P)-dependent oxidoreductase [Hydrogenophaga sp. PBL-H3]|nr:SDR family NAD(P)-dependent oxidoreductase [Hydrogenophaga sp. PBL-H3]
MVTGASDGIGRAFARLLAARGHSLVLVARRGPQLLELAEELRCTHGTRCLVFEVNLARAGSIASLEMATRSLDISMLVAAAGFGTSGELLDAPLDTELNMLDVNCAAVLALCWHFGQRFRQRGGGGVVLMSSLLAFHGVPRAAHYAATKAYVQTLAEGLRVEFAPLGIDVIASAPGPVATGFARRANLHMPRALDPDIVARETLAALGHKTTVRPGWLSKLLGWTLAMLPRWGQVRVITQVMKGMTAHQSPERAASRPR